MTGIKIYLPVHSSSILALLYNERDTTREMKWKYILMKDNPVVITSIKAQNISKHHGQTTRVLLLMPRFFPLQLSLVFLPLMFKPEIFRPTVQTLPVNMDK